MKIELKSRSKITDLVDKEIVIWQKGYGNHEFSDRIPIKIDRIDARRLQKYLKNVKWGLTHGVNG